MRGTLDICVIDLLAGSLQLRDWNGRAVKEIPRVGGSYWVLKKDRSVRGCYELATTRWPCRPGGQP